MDKKIKQYQARLFNKLFATLPIARKLDSSPKELDCEPITHFYSNSNKKFWFTKSENKDKYIFIFGLKDKPIKDITPDDGTLIIDFDKNKQFNDDSLAMFSVKNSEIHILINYNVLQYRYPYFNTGNFQISSLKSINQRLNFKVIDLGALNEDFIENLEKFIKLSSVLKILDNDEEEIIDRKPINKDIQNETNLCKICSKDKNKVKLDSKLNNLKNLKPELCAICIEKIIVYEFYSKLIPLLKGNETKELDIAKEKYGNDQVFDIGIKLLEKYNIIKFIGVKKLFFTIDKKSDLISQYKKHSDMNNLLIDNIIQAKKPKSKKKTQQIDVKKTNLTKKTTSAMNLFINAIKAGKDLEKAYKIANVNAKHVENWYNLGKKGDINYIQFYENYKPFKPENKEKMEKMEIFLDTLKKDGNIDNALEKADLSISKVRAWYSLGEKEHADFKDFYLACNILLPNGIPKKETKKIVNNDELMNEFIVLIENGKSNDEAIKQLNIPKFKVKNWFNQGKLGNKKYVDFYNAYMIEKEKEKKLKEAEEQEKLLKKQKIQKEKQLYEVKKQEESIEKQDKLNRFYETNPKTNEKICKICGRTLSNKTSKDICKRCLRKQYASKILLKLLKSIQPEKPFKKEDLKVLGLQNIQIQDYIWTLKEFNLIDEKNNKLQLKNKNELEKFIKESDLDIDEIPQQTNSIKLNKKCKTCGETLEISKFFSSEISEDGFEDSCKECKRKITTASYLNEIVEFIDYEKEFTENDLKSYYKNPIQLQAKIWALLDNDLIKKNFERNTFTLTDKKTAETFLDKYYEEKTGKQLQTEHHEYPTNQNPKDLTKKDQMTIVIQAISEGKSRKEAAKIANIPIYKITHWYHEGRHGFGKDNVNFFKQLKGLEKINQTKKPIDNSEIKEKEYINNAINRKIFLENFKAGKTKEESAANADIDLSLVHEWYLKGKNNEKPYVEFYENYMAIKNNDTETKIPKLETTDRIGNQTAVNQMNMILEALANGKSEKEAIDEANISENKYKYWLNRGKQEFGELYTQFYYHVKELKKRDDSTENPSNNKEKELKEILISLDEKYETSFKSSKMNRTGIAWVNIIGKQWVYQKSHENSPIRLSNSNIYKLYLEVINNNLPWGVRDLDLAKPLVLKYYELDTEKETEKQNKVVNITPKINDPGIYAPLPEEYEVAFKSSPMNKTGIAWVNNRGTSKKWIYEKQVNGELISIDDENIYELYIKVKNENQIWGIRDYERAKKIIDIPDDFEIPQKEKTVDTSNEIPEYINPDIYSPLPKELSYTFKPSQANKTGIAWVNKSGSNWRYSRKINGKLVEVIDENIYKLHEKVKYLNYDWGILDYQKAKNIIQIPNTYLTEKKTSDIKPIITSKNITVTFLEKPMGKFDIIIKGIIKNKELITILNRFSLFEENIKRIITNSINYQVDIFIELELKDYLLKKFEEEIEDLGWKINK